MMARDPKHNKTRSKAYERSAAEFLTDVTGEPWRRTAQVRGIGGVADIEPVDPDSPYRRLHVEVKSGLAVKLGSAALADAFGQACRDAPSGSVPVVLWYTTRIGWALTFPDTRGPYHTTGPTSIGLTLRHLASEAT